MHLNQRDVTMIAVSRAPYSKLAEYQKRMGSDFKWFSSYDTDFNFYYHVSFTQEELAKKVAFYNYIVQDAGIAEGGRSQHLFQRSCRSRVSHLFNLCSWRRYVKWAYHYLDLVPKGRDEVGHANPQFWVRRHDEFGRSTLY